MVEMSDATEKQRHSSLGLVPVSLMAEMSNDVAMQLLLSWQGLVPAFLMAEMNKLLPLNVLLPLNELVLVS